MGVVQAEGTCRSGSFGVARKPEEQEWRYRPLNSYPGQGFGLGVSVVQDTAKAGLHPLAVGTCWWMGLASTYFAFNPNTDIGCVILAQDLSCVTRQEALADIINAAHEALLD